MKRLPQNRLVFLALVTATFIALLRFSLMKPAPASVSTNAKEWYIGSYGPDQPCYEPKWLDARADRTFTLRSGFDAGREIDGKLAFEWIESGHWYPESADRIVLVVESQIKIEPLYYVTFFKETPRGTGLFISKESSERASWDHVDRFLTLKEPDQALTAVTPAAAPGPRQL